MAIAFSDGEGNDLGQAIYDVRGQFLAPSAAELPAGKPGYFTVRNFKPTFIVGKPEDEWMLDSTSLVTVKGECL